MTVKQRAKSRRPPVQSIDDGHWELDECYFFAEFFLI